MKAQTPATGILKQGDFGDAVLYYVQCECMNDECAHVVEVEADDTHVTVNLYSTHHTKWWNKGRWSQIWQILTKGRAEMQTTIVMNEQTAANYAGALNSAVEDTKAFKAKEIAARQKKNSS